MRLTIVDYGVGNLRSVQKAFETVGYPATITGDPTVVLGSEAVVLPGVGAFGKGMDNLRQAGLVDVLREVAARGTPLIGICLGMQLLFDGSDEAFGPEPPRGLGIVPGWVRRFTPGVKVPQIGWNQLVKANPSPLLTGIEDDSFVYFVHSYYVDPQDTGVVATWTEYGQRFASGIASGNVMGIQFHPEKSSSVGLHILRNFGEYAEKQLQKKKGHGG